MQYDDAKIKNGCGWKSVEINRRKNQDEHACGAPAFHSFPQSPHQITSAPKLEMRPGVVDPAAEFVGVLPVSAKAKPDLEATAKVLPL